MVEQYRIPTVDEFIPGFKYEYLYDDTGWTEKEVPKFEFRNDVFLQKLIDNKKVRVKI